ncbi:MAG: hypothetical protein KGO96_13795 [Elusimicrobia bacterium]|nr:hypothetical protein [Elusimicrobiota bacterium]MDE2236266.1 hypothetical protein [Elusimicrobiota bacterium]MDE2426968.1 hypothetical protein [Elusimicrobiota bacterium]
MSWFTDITDVLHRSAGGAEAVAQHAVADVEGLVGAAGQPSPSVAADPSTQADLRKTGLQLQSLARQVSNSPAWHKATSGGIASSVDSWLSKAQATANMSEADAASLQSAAKAIQQTASNAWATISAKPSAADYAAVIPETVEEAGQELKAAAHSAIPMTRYLAYGAGAVAFVYFLSFFRGRR